MKPEIAGAVAEFEKIRTFFVHQAPPLQPLRFHSPALLEKVGVLPFRRKPPGGIEFLVHAPDPKRDKFLELPFAIARGTREMEVQMEDGTCRRVDIGRWDGQGKVQWREDGDETAKREVKEELGVTENAVKRWYDCGPLRYHSEKNGLYGIHFFLAELKPGARLQKAVDSREVRWIVPHQAHELAAEGQFNSRYLPLLDALSATAHGYLQESKIAER